jgi:hypothetical protein
MGPFPEDFQLLKTHARTPWCSAISPAFAQPYPAPQKFDNILAAHSSERSEFAPTFKKLIGLDAASADVRSVATQTSSGADRDSRLSFRSR